MKQILMLMILVVGSMSLAQSNNSGTGEIGSLYNKSCVSRKYSQVQLKVLSERIIAREALDQEFPQRNSLTVQNVLKLQEELSDLRSCEESAFQNNNYVECLYAVPTRFQADFLSCVENK